MKNSYQQLTYEQRCQIFTLNKRHLSQREIAQEIGVNQSTISRELRRNKGGCGYRFKQAHTLAVARRKDACGPTKMTPQIISLIESKIRIDWSPEQISGWLLTEKDVQISHETIYLHIWSDKRAGGDLYEHLRRQGKKYNKRRNGTSGRGHIPDRQCIETRPNIVDEKSRVGDWEIDTVIGKNHQGALVTIVERVTKMTLSAVIPNKSASEVTRATIQLLEPYKEIVRTITADNGKEFSGHRKISQALNAQVYFAHPYASWERGLNENTNGLIRQYFPKNTNFRRVSPAQVNYVVRKLNTRPRKTLNFKTPYQALYDHRMECRQ